MVYALEVIMCNLEGESQGQPYIRKIDIEVVIASKTKQSRFSAMRLPRTLRVLAMTNKTTLLIVYVYFSIVMSPA